MPLKNEHDGLQLAQARVLQDPPFRPFDVDLYEVVAPRKRKEINHADCEAIVALPPCPFVREVRQLRELCEAASEFGRCVRGPNRCLEHLDAPCVTVDMDVAVEQFDVRRVWLDGRDGDATAPHVEDVQGEEANVRAKVKHAQVWPSSQRESDVVRRRVDVVHDQFSGHMKIRARAKEYRLPSPARLVLTNAWAAEKQGEGVGAYR